MTADQILRAAAAALCAGLGAYAACRLLQLLFARHPHRALPPRSSAPVGEPEPASDALLRDRVLYQVREAGLLWSWPAFLALSAMTAVALGVLVGRTLANPYAAALALVLGARVPYEYVAFLRDRRRDLIRRYKADALGGIIAMQTTYPSWPAAIEQSLPLMVGPLRTECERAVREYATGVPFPRVMHALAQRLRDPDVSSFVSLILSSRDSGADPAQACRDLLLMIQDHQKEQMDLKAETVAPRVSVYGVLALATWYFYKHVQSDPWSHYIYTRTLTGQLLVAGALAVVLITLVALGKLSTARG